MKMKNLYNILNEGILDVDDVIDQLEDAAELGCLEKIFKLIGGFIDKQRQIDNTWQPASATGTGKEVTIYLDQDKYQELLKLIRQFMGIADSMRTTPEQSKVISENPKGFIIGHVYEIHGRFKLELLIPQGSKFVLYSIVSGLNDYSLYASIIPVSPHKEQTRGRSRRGDTMGRLSGSNDGNFVIPGSKSINSKIKGFLYNFDGFKRM